MNLYSEDNITYFVSQIELLRDFEFLRSDNIKTNVNCSILKVTLEEYYKSVDAALKWVEEQDPEEKKKLEKDQQIHWQCFLSLASSNIESWFM